MTDTSTKSRLGWVVALTSTAYFMVVLDSVVVITALPRMQRDLHVSLSSLQWTLNAYGSKEALHFYADQVAGRYSISTNVQITSGGSVPVTATSSITNLGTKSASGQSVQTIWITFGGE